MNAVFNILGYFSDSSVKSHAALFFLNLFCWIPAQASFYQSEKELVPYLEKKYELSKNTLNLINKTHEIFSHATSSVDNGQQNLSLITFGLHPKSCEHSFSRLKLIENYPRHISYLKKISYSHPEKKLILNIDHLLLPFPLVVNILIEYPSRVQNYPFIFPDGFLKGLTGQISLIEKNEQCLYLVEASFKGEKSPLPSVLLSTIAQTLSEIGASSLFRISQF